MTPTFVMLLVSGETYTEIHDILLEAGYQHLIQDDGSIHMFSVGIEPSYEKSSSRTTRDKIIHSLQTNGES